MTPRDQGDPSLKRNMQSPMPLLGDISPSAEARTELSLDIEMIDPEKAKYYLSLSVQNRNVSYVTVALYQREMEKEMWRLSADPIRFNTDGHLIDGQHRLMACIKAQRPFETLVARGLPPETINVVDTGRARRASDVLALNGFTNSFLLASAARWLMVMRDGLSSPTSHSGLLKPSNEEVLEFVKRHPELSESAALAKRPKGILPSLLVAIHYVGKYNLKKEELADAFLQVFTKGIPHFEQDDPALKLREMNLENKLKGVAATPRHAYIQAIYVWNAFSEKRSIPVFRLPESISVKGLRPSSL